MDNKEAYLKELASLFENTFSFNPAWSHRVAEALYTAGYRKLLKKPKVLSVPDEVTNHVMWKEMGCRASEILILLNRLGYSPQAQLEADIKHIWGKND